MNLLPPPRDLLLFITAAVVLLVIPGPAVLYIVARSVDQGRKAGLASCSPRVSPAEATHRTAARGRGHGSHGSVSDSRWNPSRSRAGGPPGGGNSVPRRLAAPFHRGDHDQQHAFRPPSAAVLVPVLLSGAAIGRAQQIVSGTLLASLRSGSLAGTSFAVSFTYDASQPPAQGQVFLQLITFSFTLRGIPFTRNEIFQGGQVVLRDGKFENVTASFQVRLPPNSPVNNISFGFGGDGVIGYIGPAGNYGTGTFELSAAAAAVNTASFNASEPLAPGALATVFGTGFSSAAIVASAIPLPWNLGGVSVTVAGVPAPLLYVSPSQINVQIPWEVAVGTVDLVVITNGTALTPLKLAIGTVSPGVFSLQWGIGQAIAINPDGSLAAPEGSVPGVRTHAARAGDCLMVFATGLGAVTPSVADGVAAGNLIRNAKVAPMVLIGGVPAQVLFAGMSPVFVGVNQLNVLVPSVVGDTVPLQIDTGGIRTDQKTVIAVRSP